MQVIVSLAGSTRGLQPSWTNLDAWQKTSILVDEHFRAKTDLENIRLRFGSEQDALIAHRAKLVNTIERLQNAADYHVKRAGFDEEAQREHIAASNLADDMMEAVDIIDNRLRPMEETITEHQTRAETTLTALMEQLRSMKIEKDRDHYVPDLPEEKAHFQATEDIFQMEELEGINKELDDVDEKRRADELWGDTPERYRTDPEISRRDREEVDLLNAFGDCKTRQKELLTHERTAEEERELEELEYQIGDLGHQLALLGVPIEDNSIVLDDVAYDPSNAQTWNAEHQEDSKADSLSQNYLRKPNTLSGVQPGLFDDVDDIDRPSASLDDEMPLTGAEMEAKASNLRIRTCKWLDSVDETCDPMRVDAVLPLREPGDGFELLGELNTDDSITHILMASSISENEVAGLKSRRRAWAIQLARDRKETAGRVEAESPWIERPPRHEEWLK